MGKEWSKHWKASTQGRKQRKYKANAPLHVRHSMMSSLLSKDLRKKYGKRNIPVRTGDRVKVMRGQFKKRTGKVARVDLTKLKAYIEGIELIKKDGSKVPYPLHPSNFMVTELNLDDKERKKKLETAKAAPKGTVKGESKNG